MKRGSEVISCKTKSYKRNPAAVFFHAPKQQTPLWAVD